MNIDEQYPSKYLSASDIPEDADLVLTIKGVAVEMVGQGDKAETKPIVYFNEHKKGLLCNKTNKETIKGLYGRETDDWTGKKIALFAAEVDYQGKQTMGIRVRMRAPKAGNSGNGSTQSYAARYQELVAEATGLGLAFPTLDPAAADSDIMAAGKALRAKIEAAKAEAF